MPSARMTRCFGGKFGRGPLRRGQPRDRNYHAARLKLVEWFVHYAVGTLRSHGRTSGGPGSTPCAQMGRVCQNGLNGLKCVDGLAYRGSLRGLCGSDSASLCCVRPDANGRLPAQLGSDGICGNIVCDPGSTCASEIDFEDCRSGCHVDAGCASCGSISCDVGCTCLDAARNHCGC
jgi:hypothetical protein